MVRGECSNIDRTEVMQHLKIGLAWSLKHLEGVYFGSTSGKKKFDQITFCRNQKSVGNQSSMQEIARMGFARFFLSQRSFASFFSLSQNFFARVLSFKNVLPGFLFKRVIPLTSHMLEENMCPWQLCFKLKWIYGNNVFVSFNSLYQLMITEMYLWVDSQWFYFSSKRLEVVCLCSIFLTIFGQTSQTSNWSKLGDKMEFLAALVALQATLVVSRL